MYFNKKNLAIKNQKTKHSIKTIPKFTVTQSQQKPHDDYTQSWKCTNEQTAKLFFLGYIEDTGC